MIETQLAAGGRARLWGATELPRLTGPPALERVTHADARAEPDRTGSLAIEVAVPRGPITSYGLLGAVFKGQLEGSLTVTVLSGADGVFDDALVSAPEEPIVGLPIEYSASVLDGFSAGAHLLGGVPSGTLVFDRAVHGMVGSSPIVFRSLASTVTRLVLGDATPWDVALGEELARPQ